METVFYICILATAAIFVVCFVLFCRLQRHRHYLCPHCGYKYKPGGLSAFFARRVDVTRRLLTCPVCSGRNYMENYDDSYQPCEKENEG